jgi:hypothetical protein
MLPAATGMAVRARISHCTESEMPVLLRPAAEEALESPGDGLPMIDDHPQRAQRVSVMVIF